MKREYSMVIAAGILLGQAAGLFAQGSTTVVLPVHTLNITHVSDWNDWQLNINGTYVGSDSNDPDLTSFHFRNLPGDVTDPWEYEDFVMPAGWTVTRTAPGAIFFQTSGTGLGPILPGPMHWHFDTDYTWSQILASGTQIRFDYSNGSLTPWQNIPEPSTLAILGTGVVLLIVQSQKGRKCNSSSLSSSTVISD